MRARGCVAALALLSACASPSKGGGAGDDGATGDGATDGGAADGGAADGGDGHAAPDTGDGGADDGADSGGGDTGAPAVVYEPWPFADAVISYTPGAAAGYGQDRFPDVVFGPPEAPGDGGGSLDVLSLGDRGEIVLELRALDLVDGPGVDLLVFENPFVGWTETGVVGVSADGVDWVEWPCAADDAAGMFPGCAGVALVYSNSGNGVDATDPEAAGGDAFDLAEIGVERARFVRIRDSGANSYEGLSGGFDLDAIAALHAEPR